MSSVERMPIRVFCSYSDEDLSLQKRLEKHLNSLVREGRALVWDKHKIKPGQEHRREIDNQLERADLILLLISANFISSDDCYASDLTKALRRRQNDRIRVVPILLKPCTWDELAFSPFQVLPRNQLAVTLWRNQDEAFQQIVEEIKGVIQDIHSQYKYGYMEPLPLRSVSNELNGSSRSIPTHETSTPRRTNSTQRKRGTRINQQENTLKAEATKPANTRYLKGMPRGHPTSQDSTIRKFLTFFFHNLSGHGFNQRCKRWKGKSAVFLFSFALFDLFILPYAVYQQSHSSIITGVMGILSLFLFSMGVFNEDNAIGVTVALIYFPIWIVMGLWFLNSYLGLGLSQLSVFFLICITVIFRLLLFLWRSPFGQR